ncbi:MAG: hypothetical protein Q9174_005652 [Haloplaca sp. 1 TL-2023]
MSYIDRHNGKADTDEACLIMYQIVKAVSYLHGEGVTHRDVKPENILLSTTKPGARVILTDFGAVAKFNKGPWGRSKRMQTMIGTVNYVAPEVRGANRHSKQPGYTSAVDMWSIGCVTSVLLTGSSAFVVSQVSADRQASAATIIEAAAKCDLRRLDNSQVWDGIDTRAKDFIKHLLILHEGQRLTAYQASTHDWFMQKRPRVSIERRYNQAIADWTIHFTARDFKKDIAHFIDRRIPKDDPRKRCKYDR